MKVDSLYRTVVIQIFPTREQEKLLRRAEVEVLKFINCSRSKLVSLIRKSFENEDISTRSIVLLAHRFTGSLGNKAIIPFDSQNSGFVKDGDNWYVEVKLKRVGGKERILICRPDCKYYECIEEMCSYPFVITRENSQWFVYVSIPVETKSNCLVVGIDFNFRKWVAAPYEGRPIFFDVRSYEEKIERLQKLIGRFYRRREHDKARECYRKICEVVKTTHREFLSRIKRTYGSCTLAAEEVEKMYKLTEKDNKLVNNWLYTKLAMRKFILRAMSKGFEVVEVDPRDTTRKCFRCDNEVQIYGRRKRLIRCTYCGLKDYNRDLNAARNIAKKARLKES